MVFGFLLRHDIAEQHQKANQPESLHLVLKQKVYNAIYTDDYLNVLK